MARAFDLPTLFLRIEGGVLLAISILLYAQTEQSWWLFALFLLAPDVSIAGYAGGPTIGAVTYNIAHTYLLPAGLAVLCAAADLELPLALALVWFAHIGMDRLLGYGLKRTTGFRDTHLGRIGRDR